MVIAQMRKALAAVFSQKSVDEMSDAQVEATFAKGVAEGKFKVIDLTKPTKQAGKKPAKKSSTPSAGKSLVAGASGGKNAGSARVKSPFERYDTKRPTATNARTGLSLPLPSKLETAKMATFIKFSAMKSGLPVEWSEHDEQMIQEMYARDRWQRVKGMDHEEEITGEQAKGIIAQKQLRMTPFGTKAMLDDSTSGGLELAPIYFDDLLTTFPLLHGELMPYVRITDIPRGRRIESGSLGNPTMTWGSSEGTALTPFTTTSLAAAIDRTIFPLTCVVEVGQDFLSDAGVDVASALVSNIGQAALKELDTVIATGDGSTQPLGLVNTSGFTAVSSDNSTSGPPTVSDLESLYFALPKQYRTPDMNVRFVWNDVTHRRIIGIPVGPTDERRVVSTLSPDGSALDAYKPYGVGASINAGLTNSQAMCACLKLFQLYRRLGTTFTWHDQGNYLAIRNMKLLVVRGRFGGGMRDANGLAFCSDMQS